MELQKHLELQKIQSLQKELEEQSLEVMDSTSIIESLLMNLDENYNST